MFLIRDGVMVWVSGAGLRAQLSMLELASPAATPVIIEDGLGGPCDYAIDGDRVIWCWDGNLILYSRQTGQRQFLWQRAWQRGAYHPVLWQQTVAWTNQETPERNGTLMTYDMTTGLSATVVAETSQWPRPVAMAAPDHFVFTVRNPDWSSERLYVTSLAARDLRIGTYRPLPQPQQSTTLNGQIRIDPGNPRYFRDDKETWYAQGVQFFLTLADTGINNRSFDAQVYRRNDAATNRRELLRHAQRLGAKTLRIFVGIPGEEAPADYWDIYDFAQQAESYGMRIAIVLHNSRNFAMTAAKRNWINNLITCFQGNDPEPGVGLPEKCGGDGISRFYRIAYVSADNEINNHCDLEVAPGQKRDCYQADRDNVDGNPDFMATYIRDANRWVYAVRCLFVQRQTNVLVTVGMSMDTFSAPGVNAVPGQNFTRDGVGNYVPGTFPADCSTPPPNDNTFPPLIITDTNTLGQVIDFPSIHHYGTIADFHTLSVRREGYNGMVVLEEHGAPTDSPNFNDPDLQLFQEIRLLYPTATAADVDKCRTADVNGNLDPICLPAAAHIINEQIRDLRDQTNVALASGLVWMLADNPDKNRLECANRNIADQHTGLFTIDNNYPCNGTVTRGFGHMKATGSLICHYYGGVGCGAATVVGRLYMPISNQGQPVR